jgi:hypothetical protein
MNPPDDACKHLDKCGELGKISDSCFQVNESKEQILARMRSRNNDPLRRNLDCTLMTGQLRLGESGQVFVSSPG